ncbi:MAG: hypothetical protein REI94_03715 [Moraxellaceae bacterium]|nr:hypothetical protein [Moraxellaceae bacterium]
MYVATFTFGDDPVHLMEVHWSSLGFEKYVLDGRVLQRRWAVSFTGERVFDVDGKRIRIAFSVSPAGFYSKALVDDETLVEELFPEIAARFEKLRSRQGGWRRFVSSFAIWMVVGIVVMYGYHSYKAQGDGVRGCAKQSHMVADSSETTCPRTPG